jgi:hypothetical protein
VLVVLGLVALVVGCGSPTPAPTPSLGGTARFPDTPVGRQASWLIRAVAHHPIPAAEFPAHFDSGYLSTVPAPAAATLNASWQDIQSLRLDSITGGTPSTLVLVVTTNGTNRLSVTVAVDTEGLISRLHLQPAGSRPPASLPGASPPATFGVQLHVRCTRGPRRRRIAAPHRHPDAPHWQAPLPCRRARGRLGAGRPE